MAVLARGHAAFLCCQFKLFLHSDPPNCADSFKLNAERNEGGVVLWYFLTWSETLTWCFFGAGLEPSWLAQAWQLVSGSAMELTQILLPR